MNYSELTKEQLESRIKNGKTLIFIFIPLVMGLGYYASRGLWTEDDIDLAIVTIAICTLGGLVVSYDDYKKAKAELKRRAE